MSVLRDKIIREHIENNYPNAKIESYEAPDSDLRFYSVKELAELDGDWFPLCCYKDEERGELIYGGRDKVYHTYTEGETGAGKTTRFVMQSIRALSSMKVKPSFVIVDIHGEIVENLYRHLVDNGYCIKILNCDDPERSDTYNPFSDMVRECVESGEISSETIDRIRRISEIVQPVESTSDPIWDRGARAYTNGAILDQFEDLVAGEIPPECVTLYNVIQNHYWLRNRVSEGLSNWDLFSVPHFKKKGSKALSVQKMIAVTNNADRTRASYFGVVENHYDIFGQPAFYKLSSSNTIDLSDFIERPTAIVIQSGSTKIGDDLISMLVNDIYTRVVKMGKESPTKRLPRNIHCFLDEFANCNIADGPDYVKMLTTSRKFGMFWHMILQCDAQLDRKFDQYIGKIIRSNSTEIFMGSQDHETMVRFAQSCGQKTIESLSSVISQCSPSLETVPLMTAEELNLIPEGYAFIKGNRHSLLKTYIEAYYNCKESRDRINIDSVYPHNDFDYTTTLHYPEEETQKAPRVDSRLRHPDPWKIDTEPEPPKKKSAPPKDEMPEVNIFFDDESGVDKNPQFKDLKAHLPKKPRKEVEDTLAKLSCIPEFLLNAVKTLYSKKTYKGEFPMNANVMKFEIIETYIANNNFKTKAEWDAKISAEYEELKKSGVLPASILKAFERAEKEINEELTLSNIKEIKKIISGE